MGTSGPHDEFVPRVPITRTREAPKSGRAGRRWAWKHHGKKCRLCGSPHAYKDTQVLIFQEGYAGPFCPKCAQGN